MQESDIFRVARRLEGLALAEYLNDACGTDVDCAQMWKPCLKYIIASKVPLLRSVVEPQKRRQYRCRPCLQNGIDSQGINRPWGHGARLPGRSAGADPACQVAIKIIKSSHASQAILT